MYCNSIIVKSPILRKALQIQGLLDQFTFQRKTKTDKGTKLDLFFLSFLVFWINKWSTWSAWWLNSFHSVFSFSSKNLLEEMSREARTVTLNFLKYSGCEFFSFFCAFHIHVGPFYCISLVFLFFYLTNLNKRWKKIGIQWNLVPNENLWRLLSSWFLTLGITISFAGDKIKI